MKLYKSVIAAVFAFMVGSTIAKNVVNPSFTDEQLQNVVLELEQNEFNLGKREAKNVIDLNLYIDDNLNVEKRDSKNVFDAQLIVDEDSLFKRDGKNVFDFNLVINDANLEKRDGKNVFGLNLVIDDSGLEKRDPKNVVNVNMIIEDNSDLVKRGIENVVDLSIEVPEYSSFIKTFEEPTSMGYIIGSDQFTVESFKHIDNHNVELKLKKDSHGCKNKKSKLYLDSLSEILETFKIKMFDPVIEAKDKFVLPEDDGDVLKDAVLEPIEGDIATALVQRSDLGVFAKYLRESPELYRKCETISASNNEDILSKKQILIFAPNNEALMKLDRKPWEFPEDIENAKSEDEQDTMVARNIANFVESHFVETENFNISSNSKSVEFVTSNGNVVVFENSGDSFRIQLKDSNTWLDVTDMEILNNGAILTINAPLVK